MNKIKSAVISALTIASIVTMPIIASAAQNHIVTIKGQENLDKLEIMLPPLPPRPPISVDDKVYNLDITQKPEITLPPIPKPPEIQNQVENQTRQELKIQIQEQNDNQTRVNLPEQIKNQIQKRLEEKARLKLLSKEEKQQLLQRELAKRIFVRGINLNYDVPPVIKDGRTLIPIRAISEGLGAKVDWDEKTQTITISRDDKTIQLTLNQSTVSINGQIYNLDTPAQLINNRTFVPLRFVSEMLGEKVDYDEETGDIDVGLS